MGRTEPSIGRPPAAFRRDARAKKAKATLNQLIPSLLSTHPRSKRGIDTAEVIVNLPAHRGDTSPGALPRDGPTLTLRVADTLTAAHLLLQNTETGAFDLTNKESKVAILNMASPLSPGGGFLNGANSQEESLCMRTSLLPSLKDEWYRLPEVGAIYTPDVLVFRDEEGEQLEKRDRWFVDCISAAMLRGPETEMDGLGRGRYVNSKDREVVSLKMKMVLRICQAKGVKRLVLGAWGCGAYGNPVGEIATAWKKVLLPGKETKGKAKGKSDQESWKCLEEVVFAINNLGMAEAFGQAFGDELVLAEPSAQDEDDETGAVEDPKKIQIKELQEKINELELRIEQTVNTQVKSGLSSVLNDLKNQLPQATEAAEVCEEDEDESAGENESKM